MHKLNANLLRRWLEKAESGATTTGGDVTAMKLSVTAPIEVPCEPPQVIDYPVRTCMLAFSEGNIVSRCNGEP
jgi:hypothetical protein